MTTFHLYLVIFFILSSFDYSSSLKTKPIISSSFKNNQIISSNCIQNLTSSNQYAPFFKNSKICSKNANFTLVPFGEKYSFDCTFDSNPASKITWMRSKSPTNLPEPIEGLKSSKLSIESTSLEDEGHYSCIISNSLGLISHTFYLKVNDLPLVYPIFKHKEEEFIGEENSQVTLDCNYMTDELSTLKFYKANRFNNFTYEELIKLNGNSKRADNVLYSIDSIHKFDPLPNELNSSQSPFTLTIDNLKEDNFGIYMCVANNRYGKSVKFINLKKEQTDYFKFIILYSVTLIIFILMILLIFQVYLKNRIKKKLILEKQKPKSYVITKKITIDYYQTKANSNNVEMNSYMNCSIVPRVEIVKERKEIISNNGTMNELNRMDDYFEIDLDPNWEIDRDCLKLDETIGHGNFGIVMRAFLYNLPLISKDFSKNKSIYVNHNVYASTKKNCPKQDESSTTKQLPPVTYTDINQLNYNYIVDHFKNNSLNNNITAFSNNYYGIQDTIQFGQYGRLEFIKSPSSDETNDSIKFERKCRVVAVKKLRQDYNETDVKNFISEMVMMKLYGNHPNIINLIGICTQDGPFYVIMEYAEKGNLKDFLKNYRINNCCVPFTNEQRLTSKDLISFALQIASGMQHLARLHCIHRDLAARNVLVTSNLTMKIADFGLSRNTGDSEYYRKSSDSFVPIKWLAPECISCSLYTIQTDVWSYAVTLWELTSLGNSPYEKVDPQNMYLYLKAGNRMSKPLWSNEEMYQLMLDCWSWDPKNRPLFDEIILRLKSMCERELEIRYIIYQDLPTPESSINSDYSKDQYLE